MVFVGQLRYLEENSCFKWLTTMVVRKSPKDRVSLVIHGLVYKLN